MKQHLNTLFIMTQGAYLAREREAVVVKIDREAKLRVPLINIGGIVCFGRIGVSPSLLGKCGEAGVAVSFLSEHGRFLARSVGFTSGNVLLRRQQYRSADDPKASASIASNLLAGKMANSRVVLQRAVRDGLSDHEAVQQVNAASQRLAENMRDFVTQPDLDALRGLEGDAAGAYFSVFQRLIGPQGDGFVFNGRSRRPPRDNINALLSFLYAMLTHDVRSACETVGLDAAVGFLHRDRPGRPGLALDLMEELRPVLADRLALSMINRRQVSPKGFHTTEAGGVVMDELTRKAVISAYQKRKQQTLMHPFLNEKVTLGLVAHLQARLLARHLRGDLDAYPPFLWK